MPEEIIEKGDPVYQKLLNVWIAQGSNPGNITLSNGKIYKVLQPEAGVVKFAPQSAELYGSMSQG